MHVVRPSRFAPPGPAALPYVHRAVLTDLRRRTLSLGLEATTWRALHDHARMLRCIHTLPYFA